tara:strand:- start:201 stop:1046 length:846 start_codon:yes stop_codon:yes gene_type:complete
MTGENTTTLNEDTSLRTSTDKKCQNLDINSSLDTKEEVTSWIADARQDMLEMAQLKSDLDCDQFTRGKQGPFLAHQFHFIMRQYTFALHELRRMMIDNERRKRRKQELIDKYGENGRTESGDWVDLKLYEIQNEIELEEISQVNKRSICINCEKIRQKLIELNGGKPFTNEQYQQEEPEYWKWEFSRKIVQQARQSQTGVQEGVWINLDHLEQPPLLNPAHEVSLKDETGSIEFDDCVQRVEQGIEEARAAIGDSFNGIAGKLNNGVASHSNPRLDAESGE